MGGSSAGGNEALGMFLEEVGRFGGVADAIQWAVSAARASWIGTRGQMTQVLWRECEARRASIKG